MIVTRIKGGLGNQLFQYAATYALSKRLDQDFAFDPYFTANMTERNYKLPLLCVESDNTIPIEQLPKKIKYLKNAYINKICRLMNWSRHKCDEYMYWIETRDVWQPDFFAICNSNIYVDGYFQSEDYFREYRKDLLAQLKPRYAPENEYLMVLKEIVNCNSVAVHVRRGDFKRDNNKFHYLLGREYYERAISEIRKRVPNPIFFLFSDDMEWVRGNLEDTTAFRYISIGTTNGDIDDMMLMKNCKHIITANSTFSWWAAWLNEDENALKIVPKRPFGMEKMIPIEWIKI